MVRTSLPPICTIVLVGNFDVDVEHQQRIGHLFGPQSEQEEVFLPHFLPDFDVRSIQCADGQSTVQGELHVAGSRCFGARG